MSSSIFKPSSSEGGDGDGDPEVMGPFRRASHGSAYDEEDERMRQRQGRHHNTQKPIKLKQMRLKGDNTTPVGGGRGAYMF